MNVIHEVKTFEIRNLKCSPSVGIDLHPLEWLHFICQNHLRPYVTS